MDGGRSVVAGALGIGTQFRRVTQAPECALSKSSSGPAPQPDSTVDRPSGIGIDQNGPEDVPAAQCLRAPGNRQCHFSRLVVGRVSQR